MTYVKIEIPGGGTGFDDAPSVKIIGGGNSDLTVVIKYVCDYIKENELRAFGEISFKGVFEYRWVVFSQEYSPYENDEEDEVFELIQITDSKWIETMASNSPFQNYPEMRFGPYIKESDIKHFRIAFDDYGQFDIICFEIEVRKIFE